MAEALIAAKRKKEILLESIEREKRAQINRKFLTSQHFSFEQTKGFMLYRAGQIFNDAGKPFILDETNQAIFDLLCLYFSHDSKFVSDAENLGILSPSLEKGILLAGNFGVGKTWIMTLFSRNQLQVFALHNAKEIADLFESKGAESQGQFIEPPKLPVNDGRNFYHSTMGMCIDDMGTEREKNHYGNKKSVIGDLIELRYARGHVGKLLHVTTNLKAEEIKEAYGGRVASRLREIMNIIELTGNDRRR